MVLSLPNGLPEQGNYLIHITLLPEDENSERLDAHMGFQAGFGSSTSTGTMGLYALIALAALYVFYLSNENFKRIVDEKIKGATSLK